MPRTIEKLEATREEREARKKYHRVYRQRRWQRWKCFWTPPFGHVWEIWEKIPGATKCKFCPAKKYPGDGPHG